jgi:hypothetical protein
MVVVSVFESDGLIDPRRALGCRLAEVFHFMLRDLQVGFDERQRGGRTRFQGGVGNDTRGDNLHIRRSMVRAAS